VNISRQELADQAASLAAHGVYVGTSSWKYQGWCGMLYDRSRYEYRGKFAETRFKRECLREYAEVFETVCVDAAYTHFRVNSTWRAWSTRRLTTSCSA
jgi:hypothetical protein